MGRFETELLASDENLAALTALPGAWIDKVHDRRPPKMIIFDMDSSVSPTHGDQEGTAYIVTLGCEAWNRLIDQPWRIMSIGLRQWAHNGPSL